MRVLALDFDGVIWDSVGECFEIGKRAYQELWPDELEGLSWDDLELPFRKARWLVRTGGDFYLVLRLVIQGPNREYDRFPKDEFIAMRHEYREQIQEFERRFYRLRKQYQETDFKRWLSWQRPFPGVDEVLPELTKGFYRVAVATTKDEESVHRLLATIGMELPVWGKGFSIDKGEQIIDMAKRFSVATSDVRLVDDLLENLEQVIPTGASAALAGWGYNTEEERIEAQKQGIAVLESPKEMVAMAGII